LRQTGPTIALLPFAERARGLIAGTFETFGRVPMFYYLLHIPLIHVISLAAWYLRDGSVHAERFADCAIREHAAGAAVGTRIVVSRVRDRCCDPVRRVPLVCGRQGPPARCVAAVPLSRERDPPEIADDRVDPNWRDGATSRRLMRSLDRAGER
jgi:hypothetical protein